LSIYLNVVKKIQLSLKSDKNNRYITLRRKCIYGYTGLFKMIVGVLTTCHTQYT